MNLKLLCLPLLLGSFGLQAEIYKSVDEHGNAVFTDAPQAAQEANTETVIVPELNTMEAAPVPAYTPGAETEPGFKYTELGIKPSNDSTVRSNNGDVAVTLTLTPKLQKGHQINLYLDGKKLAGSSRYFQLSNVERGTHTLRAEVVDGDNKVLIQQSSTFHLQRATAPRPAHTANDDDEISILPIFDEMIGLLPGIGDGEEVSTGVQTRWPKDQLSHYEDANGNERVSMLQPIAPTWPQERMAK